MVRFIANSRLADGVTRERVLQFFQDHAIESSTWDLVRHRIVTDHAFKVGAQPGVVLFLEADSENAAAEIVNGLPVVQNGLWVIRYRPGQRSRALLSAHRVPCHSFQVRP